MRRGGAGARVASGMEEGDEDGRGFFGSGNLVCEGGGMQVKMKSRIHGVVNGLAGRGFWRRCGGRAGNGGGWEEGLAAGSWWRSAVVCVGRWREEWGGRLVYFALALLCRLWRGVTHGLTVAGEFGLFCTKMVGSGLCGCVDVS